MKFGIKNTKELSGADLYVRIFQVFSLLPVLYIFSGSGYMAVFTKRNVLSFLFDLGISAAPRAEALLLSVIYRKTASEIIIFFIPLLISLILGIAAGKLLKGSYKTAKTTRIVFAAFIVLDLIIRLIPFYFNSAFGTIPAILGIIIRLICLALIVFDFTADKKAQV